MYDSHQRGSIYGDIDPHVSDRDNRDETTYITYHPIPPELHAHGSLVRGDLAQLVVGASTSLTRNRVREDRSHSWMKADPICPADSKQRKISAVHTIVKSWVARTNVEGKLEKALESDELVAAVAGLGAEDVVSLL